MTTIKNNPQSLGENSTYVNQLTQDAVSGDQTSCGSLVSTNSHLTHENPAAPSSTSMHSTGSRALSEQLKSRLASSSAKKTPKSTKRFLANEDLRGRLLWCAKTGDYFSLLQAININVSDELLQLPSWGTHKLLQNESIYNECQSRVIGSKTGLKASATLIPCLPDKPLKDVLLGAMMSSLKKRIPVGTSMNPQQLEKFRQGIFRMEDVINGWSAVPSRAKPEHVNTILDMIQEYGRRVKKCDEVEDRTTLLSDMSNLVNALNLAFSNGKIDVGNDWRNVVQVIQDNRQQESSVKNSMKIMRGILAWQVQSPQERFTSALVGNALGNVPGDVPNPTEDGVSSAYSFIHALVKNESLSNENRIAMLQELAETLILLNTLTFRGSQQAEVKMITFGESLIDKIAGLSSAGRSALKNLLAEISYAEGHASDSMLQNISILIPNMAMMPNAIRGYTLVEISCALAGGHGDINQLLSAMESLIPYCGSMSHDYLGTAMAWISTAFAVRNGCAAQLLPVMQALISYCGSMTDRERGCVLAHISLALAKGHGNIEQLLPLMQQLIPYLESMPPESRSTALEHLSTVLATGSDGVAQLLPIMRLL